MQRSVQAAFLACILTASYIDLGHAFVFPSSRPQSTPCSIVSTSPYTASPDSRTRITIAPSWMVPPSSSSSSSSSTSSSPAAGVTQEKSNRRGGSPASPSTKNSEAPAPGGEESNPPAVDVGIAKALAKPSESRAAELRQAKEAERTKNKKFLNPIEIPIKAGRAARRALESLGQVEEPAPKNPEDYRLYFDKKFMYAIPAPGEKTPTVLVVGATGDIGRQVVRKLILKGYRVQVLVRNLYSTTLNLLGTGVSYVKGDLSDLSSLRTACDGADKVVYVAQAREDGDARTVEYLGLRNLAQAFQDTRVSDAGKRVATKRTLFKFRKPADRGVWAVATPSAEGAEGAWTVQDERSGRPAFVGSLPVGPGGSIVLESKKLGLNLSKFGGLLMLFKAQGDAQTSFRFVIRTSAYAEQGVQYEIALPLVRNRFTAFRMNFRDFVPMKDGTPYAGVLGGLGGVTALDPGDVKQFAVMAVREGGAAAGVDAAVANPAFALTMEGIKVFRAREQADVVLLSSSDITPKTALKSLSEMERDPASFERVERGNYYRAQGELAMKNAGLAYCIVRISDFTSSPTEGRPLSVSRSGNNMGLISRPDAATVLINCLFNPTVCNTEIYASENPRYGDRDIQRLLNELVELPL